MLFFHSAQRGAVRGSVRRSPVRFPGWVLPGGRLCSIESALAGFCGAARPRSRVDAAGSRCVEA
jgi:hypothetical protein